MWRVIVRFSLDKDPSSGLRNAIAGKLQAAGINRTATGTWESSNLSAVDAANTLAGVLGQLASPPTGTSLDHIWVYIDSTP